MPRFLPKGKTTTQVCLGCDEPFESTGPGNRICAECVERNAKLSYRETRGPIILPPDVAGRIEDPGGF